MRILTIILLLVLVACTPPATIETADDLAYLAVDEIQARFEAGSLTSVELVQFHLQRIAAIDAEGPRLRAIIEINPEAETIARALDLERSGSGARGPLHGIPVVLKANIDTGDQMATTAGSLALAGRRAQDDAFHVRRLRAAGVVILGKANLSEWANFRSTTSSSGWSGIGGQVRNPHVLDRNPCGSSSGSAVAVAAGLAVLAIGTETDGSVVCPAGVNGIVGIKPTVGLVSRNGIIPIAHTQDTAGPMARSVRDAALLLTAMAARDDQDPASADHPGPVDYIAGLDPGALEGAKIGVWRQYSGSSRVPRVEAIFEEILIRLEQAGATLFDPVDLEFPEGAGDGEWEVLQYEFKADLERYLAAGGIDPAVDTLAELIAFNEANADTSMPWFGQEILESSQEKGTLRSADYLEALAESHAGTADAIDRAFAAHDLDAIVAPTNGPAWKTDWIAGDRFSVSSSSAAARSGYPSITLPMGDIHGLPIGITLFGTKWSEARLISLAFALESRLPPRLEPGFRNSIEQADQTGVESSRLPALNN